MSGNSGDVPDGRVSRFDRRSGRLRGRDGDGPGGVVAVLSGGGAATFYAPEAHQTKDLDFVLPFVATAVSERTILDVGFRPTRTRGTYARENTPFTLEFIDGPLAVGDEVLTEWSTLRRETQILNLLNPTDCVRDRLAAASYRSGEGRGVVLEGRRCEELRHFPPPLRDTHPVAAGCTCACANNRP